MTLLADLFLNSTGRIGRRRFGLGAGGLMLIWAAFTSLTGLSGWVDGLVAAALLYAGGCLLSQRLHDRGRSGWWSGPILLVVMMAWPEAAPQTWPQTWPHTWLETQTPLGWIAAAILALVAVDLLLAPGQARFNRYGRQA